MVEKRKNYFLEALLLIVGIVLGLAANEWREGIKQKNQAKKVRETIIAEIQRNRDETNRAITYHRETMGKIQEHMKNNPEEAVSIRLFNKGFIYPTKLTGTAWEAGRLTDSLSHMKYTDVLAISDVYGYQNRYGDQQMMAGGALYEMIVDDGKASLLEQPGHLMDLVGGFLYKEYELAQAYDTALASLGVEKEGEGKALLPPWMKKAQ